MCAALGQIHMLADSTSKWTCRHHQAIVGESDTSPYQPEADSSFPWRLRLGKQTSYVGLVSLLAWNPSRKSHLRRPPPSPWTIKSPTQQINLYKWSFYLRLQSISSKLRELVSWKIHCQVSNILPIVRGRSKSCLHSLRLSPKAASHQPKVLIEDQCVADPVYYVSIFDADLRSVRSRPK